MTSVFRPPRVYAPEQCPCCGQPAIEVLRDELRVGDDLLIQRCRDCGHHVLHRCPALGCETDDEYEPVVLDRYVNAMGAARAAAANRMLRSIALFVDTKRRLLDVGASFGWLVEEARRNGWQAEGIEPSEIACAESTRRGVPLKRGFFPGDLPDDGSRWQVITMMDVLEHLDNPLDILLQIRARLDANGILAIQVPNSRGMFLAIARSLARFGGRRLCGPLERMYQTQFAYPHLQYFDAANLARLLTRADFDVLSVRVTPTIVGRLCDRVGYLKPQFSGVPNAGILGAATVVGSWAIGMASHMTGLHDTFYCIARPAKPRAGALAA